MLMLPFLCNITIQERYNNNLIQVLHILDSRMYIAVLPVIHNRVSAVLTTFCGIVVFNVTSLHRKGTVHPQYKNYEFKNLQ
jgi:hypothetical protein